MSGRVMSATTEGRFKLTVFKEGFGRNGLFYYRIEEGFWWQDGGPYTSEQAAEQAAREAIERVTRGVEIR